MTDIGARLREQGIRLTSTAPGRHYATCPQCSAKRKGSHRSAKVLGVTIDHNDANWGCNHCGWTGSINLLRGNGATDRAISSLTTMLTNTASCSFKNAAVPASGFGSGVPTAKAIG